MSVNKYAHCPCGSGKKIKFCKCKDSVSQLDRVLKMVEGGQVVPALDQLSAILAEHPDAAWALAIRGRLLLELREYDSLSENADRFIRLQPGNPLALTQRAAARLFHGDVDQGIASMLEALTESGRQVDSFVLDVASALAFSLAQQGMFLTARVYATLAMMASGYEGGQAAVTVLRQLNSAPTISQFMKAVPAPIARPADVDWKERFDEADTLLHSNKIDLAESKFQSLRRTVPNEPSILSGLLLCAIWRGDTDAQSDLLKKLSGCDSLDFEQRVRYRAMSALAQPQSPELSVPVVSLEAEIDNADEMDMALRADDRFVALPPDLLAGMKMSEDDVPPRSGFQIIDRDKPESLQQLPPLEDVPEAIAVVFVYGKQTDRAARLEVHDVRRENLDEVRSRITAAAGDIELKESPDESIPLLAAVQPSIAMVRFQASPADAERLQSELAEARMPEAIATLELPILGGRSLKSTADDDSMLLERTATMRVIEQYDAIAAKGEAIIAKAYQLAGLQPLPAIKPSNDQVESLANEDLNRVDVSDLDAESLIYLLQRSQQVSSTPLLRRCANRIIGMDLSEEQRPAKMLAYLTMINSAEQNEEALKLVDEAKSFAESENIPIANLLLTEVSLRLQAGDAQGFQNALQTLTTRYRGEPEVMARLQQMLMAYGLIGPDGSPRTAPTVQAPAASTTGSSGLWTPDSGTPATPSPQDGSGSKLWVPGMD